MRTTERTVLNPSGLHARPAAMFVRTAAGFTSKVSLENLDGADEDDAITTIEAFIDGGMGETIPG